MIVCRKEKTDCLGYKLTQQGLKYHKIIKPTTASFWYWFKIFVITKLHFYESNILHKIPISPYLDLQSFSNFFKAMFSISLDRHINWSLEGVFIDHFWTLPDNMSSFNRMKLWLVIIKNNTPVNKSFTDVGIWITRVSQKFCYILVCASSLRLHHVSKAVQSVEGTCGGW